MRPAAIEPRHHQAAGLPLAPAPSAALPRARWSRRRGASARAPRSRRRCPRRARRRALGLRRRRDRLDRGSSDPRLTRSEDAALQKRASSRSRFLPKPGFFSTAKPAASSPRRTSPATVKVAARAPGALKPRDLAQELRRPHRRISRRARNRRETRRRMRRRAR